MAVIKSVSSGGRDPNATAWMGDWITGTIYKKHAQVKHNYDLFTCILTHTSAAGTEPGVGASWETNWVRQVDTITEQFDVSTGHKHTGVDSAKVAWGSVDAKPTTFAPVIGARSVDAIAGNDSRLEDSFSTFVAGEALGAYKAVYADSANAGKIYLATNAGTGKQALTVGLTTSAIDSAASGSLRVKPGFITNLAWAWTPGAALFLGTGGNLTETAPNPGVAALRPVGYAKTATEIYFDPRDGVVDVASSSDADELILDYVAVGYTPATVEGITNDDAMLASHLQGIGAQLQAGVAWGDVDFTTSDIADITTKSHTDLTDIGDTTHAGIDSHIDDATIHRSINDSGTAATDLWSASKITSSISAGMAGVLGFTDPVLDKDLLTPAALTPTTGDRYIVGSPASGDWTGHETAIAEYSTDHWDFDVVSAGITAYVNDEETLYLFSGAAWEPVFKAVYGSSEPPSVGYTTGAAGSASSIAPSDHSHDLAAHDHDGEQVNLQKSGTPTFSTLDDFVNLGSAGRISGGTLTDDGTGGVNITSVQAMLKTTDSDIGELVFVDIAGINIPSSSLTDNALNYVIVDYNSGTPRLTSTTNKAAIKLNTQFILGRLFKVGSDIECFTGGVNVYNSHRNNHDRLVMRGVERMKGCVVTETGTRNVALSEGTLYFGANKITTTAKDTSGSDTFENVYYRKAISGWSEVASVTQLSNTLYDDGSGTLATLDDGAYGCHWIYVCLNGDIYSIYGQGSYTLGQAQAVQEPTRPIYLDSFAILTAKIIVQKGVAAFNTIVSGYVSTLATIALSDHTGLSGLQGGQTGEYYHLTSDDYTDLTTNRQEVISDGVNTLLLAGTHTGITWTYDDSGNTGSLAAQYGTTAVTACAGNDSRLSNARTPTSHTIESHTATVTTGKVLTGSGTNTFGWADPAPTWTQVSGKPTTFAPVVGTGAADAAAGNHGHAYSSLSSIPSTFAPIIGTGAGDAVAGNDPRLIDARTPSTHTHPSTELTDYVAPTTWDPVTVWSGVAPVYSAVARYTKVGKMVTFWLAITGTDGDGRKLTSVTLPLEPKNVGMTISCAGQTAAPTTRSDPYAYIVANTDTAANKLLQFFTALTFANNSAFTMNVTGQYEVA